MKEGTMERSAGTLLAAYVLGLFLEDEFEGCSDSAASMATWLREDKTYFTLYKKIIVGAALYRPEISLALEILHVHHDDVEEEAGRSQARNAHDDMLEVLKAIPGDTELQAHIWEKILQAIAKGKKD